MSADSDPPPRPSDHAPDEPPAMSVPAALGWSFGVTVALVLLQSVLLKLKPGSGDDIIRDGFCQVVAYLGGLFLILRVHAPEASIRDFVGLRRTHPALYLSGLLLGVALWLPADVMLSAIEKRWPLPGEGKVAEQLFHASSPRRIAMLAMMAIVGPVVEEVLFRGALFRALRKTHPQAIAIGTTAALFAMVHGAWQLFLPIGLLGLVLGLLRAVSGSSIPGVLLHTAFNATTCALLVMSKSENGNLDVPDAFVGVSLGLAAALIGVVRLVGARSATAAVAREMDRR